MRPACETHPKIAVVTGCSRGIGQAVASLLSEDGYLVICAQRSNPQIDNCSDHKTNVRNVFLDLRCEKSTNEFSQRINDKLPYLSLLVNNAAICPLSIADQRMAEHWRSVMRVNFFGTTSLTEQLLPLLRKCPDQARVVNIFSGDGELLYFSERVMTSLEALACRTSLAEVKKGIENLLEEVIIQSSSMPDNDMVFGGEPAYKFSKVALNVYTRVASKNADIPADEQVDFVAMCPGDVDTQMSNGDGPLISPSNAAKKMRSIFDLLSSDVNGFFFRHNLKIPW